jgi:membrane associated rhomboid family serine protease
MWQFIKTMLSGSSDTSVKRVLAFMCFSFYLSMCFAAFFTTLSEIQVSMSNNIFGMGGGLIVGTMFEKFKFNSK